VPVFRIRWLNNNKVIGAVFAVLVVINAYAIAYGYY
jgi:hypothetical protein